MLMHQLPHRPSHLRVKTWRRLQQLGAVVLRNSVYVLPNSTESREDFEWLRAEITDAGGQSSVVAADVVDSYTDDELVKQFRRAREEDYERLLAELVNRARSLGKSRNSTARARAQRLARVFRDRLERLRAIDYFIAPNAERAAAAVLKFERVSVGAGPGAQKSAGTSLVPKDYRSRVWVTRARPGVDRMASAWLIRRFIDEDAHFAFVTDTARPKPAHIPFDLYDVEFGHHEGDCTIETLIRRFTIIDPAARRIADIVHDLDLKVARYGRPEAVAVGHLVEGLRALFTNDSTLLEQGIVMFDALFRSFTSAETVKAQRRPKTGNRIESA